MDEPAERWPFITSSLVNTKYELKSFLVEFSKFLNCNSSLHHILQETAWTHGHDSLHFWESLRWILESGCIQSQDQQGGPAPVMAGDQVWLTVGVAVHPKGVGWG